MLSVDQFDNDFIKRLFKRADQIDKQFGSRLGRRQLQRRLAGQSIYQLYYKPSTRTFVSHEMAASNLGASAKGTQTVEFSSVAKGETLTDTIRTLNSYGFNAIVLRGEREGDAALAARSSNVPIINAGDGSGEHPTQALLDLYTIRREFGRTDHLNIVMVGDMFHGRTVRSLVKLLAKYPGNRLIFVSPPTFEMRDDIKERLRNTGVPFEETTELRPAIEQADVVYVTRIQRERINREQRAYLIATSDVQNSYAIGINETRSMRPEARILHPFPRNDELSTDVDNDPRAAYWRQMHNGMIVRMAITEWCLGRIN